MRLAVVAVATWLVVTLVGHPALGLTAASVKPGGHDPIQPRIMQQAAAAAAAPPPGSLAPFKPAIPLHPRAAAGTSGPVAGPAAPATPAASASGPSREVFGFVNAGAIADPSVGYSTWNMSLLTTIAFFGLHVSTTNGALVESNDTGWAEWNSSDLTGLLNATHSNGVKVVVSIILQDDGQGMCTGLADASTTIPEVVSQVEQKGVDGVNVDYEGVNETCGSSTSRAMFVSFVQQLRQALPSSSYLSVDTYATSAGDSGGFFDIAGLAPYTDSFFVMAYDLDGDYSSGNWQYAPLNCSSYCFSPTSPLTGYEFNDTTTVQQYLGVVSGSKVILGIPYFGWSACVAPASAARPGPNAAVPQLSSTSPAPQWSSPTYLDSQSTTSTSGVSQYQSGRDVNDASGQEPYGTWLNSNDNCWRESYWDDTTSLAAKYDLVNNEGLRGVGIFTLDYGGGAPELWNLLATKFSPGSGTLASNAVPHAVSFGSGELHVFWRGADNALWSQLYNGSAWTSPIDLGGSLVSDPSPVTSSEGVIDVFWKGSNGNLWHTWSINGTWYGPQDLGAGTLGSGPQAVGQSDGVIDVFWRGTDNGLWHDWYVGGGWHGPEQRAPGGSVASDPSPVNSSAGVLDVFWKGSNGALWHVWYNGGWNSLASIPSGTLGSEPHAVGQPDGIVDVFWRGTDNGLWHDWYNSGWSGPEQRAPAGSVSSDPYPVNSSAGVLDVFWEGPSDNLWHARYMGGWAAAASLGSGPLGSGPTAVGQSSGVEDVFWRGTNDGLWLDWYTAGTWNGPATT